jgi:hypothetical protein
VVEGESFAGMTVPNVVGSMGGDRICNAARQDWVRNDLGMAWHYLDTNLVYKRSNQVSCVNDRTYNFEGGYLWTTECPQVCECWNLDNDGSVQL